MSTMKGFGIIVPNKETGWITKEVPELGMFDALLSPVAVCPCTSDVAGARVRGVQAGRILGHEAVGRIEAIGSMVKDFKVGDVVAVPAVTPRWYDLDIQDGLHQHLSKPLGGRFLSSVWDGVFGEFFRVPDVDMNVALIPDDISLATGVLIGDMVTTGFHGSELANIEYGDTIVVIGIGPVGLMSVAGAAIRGAGRIIAVGNRPVTRKLAMEYGASITISYKDGPIYDQVMKLTHQKPVDSVILAGGTTANIAEAYRMTKCGGTIANIAGQNNDFVLKASESTSFVAHKNLTGGLCPGGRRRLERLMELVRYGRLDPDKLISHTFNGFEKIEDAFNLMAENPIDLVKPIVYI
ncbi:MAG: zinc-binding dehydrogenase [Lachnospiraceae bacterium]|jgi:threonine dehydrogenase-like Zn-dependent dehydrogenase